MMEDCRARQTKKSRAQTRGEARREDMVSDWGGGGYEVGRCARLASGVELARLAQPSHAHTHARTALLTGVAAHSKGGKGGVWWG